MWTIGWIACGDPAPVVEAPADRRDGILAALDAGRAEDGGPLYQRDCAACHLADGSGGGPFPALATVLPALSDERIVDVMLDGIPNPPGGVGMPAYGAVYTDADFADVIAWMRAEFGG